MPKAARRTSGPASASNRKEPYTKSSPKNNTTADKENVNPISTSTSTSQISKGDYRDIVLDEIKGEVPCYDNAATVRRKLKKLLDEKSTIPGTNKKWSQASMAAEMKELEKRGHPVEYNRNAVNGPTHGSLQNFLRRQG